MLYGYCLWNKVSEFLKKELPKGTISLIRDHNKIKNLVNEDDFIFFLGMSNGDRKLQQSFAERGIIMFPNPSFSSFISKRNSYLPKIDCVTKFPLTRMYYVNIHEVKHIPRLGKSDKVVMKIGDYHCGEQKVVLQSGGRIPHLKYKLRSQPILLEEFIPNARSIRIGIVGDPNDDKNFYFAEHINSERAAGSENSWIKNIDPIEKTYLYEECYQLGISQIDEIIEDTRNIALTHHADLIGIDYVVANNKIGLLELNDMIGIPDDERVESMFQQHVLRLAQKNLEAAK